MTEYNNDQGGHPATPDAKREDTVPPPGLRGLLDEGIQAHQAGRLQEAKAAYERVLDADPDHAEGNYRLGVLAHQMGRPDIAVRLIGKALRFAPDVAAAHLHLGYALHALGRLDEAGASYREALRLDPNSADAHMNLGIALAQQGRLEGAIAQFRNALAIDPTLPDAHMNLGTALAQQGHWDDAAASYSNAIAIDPTLADAHMNLGNALTRLGRWDEAIASCREALRIDPGSAKAHMNLGTAFAQRKHQLEEAVDSYRAALAIDPDYADAHNNLGNALTRLGRSDEAVMHYRDALRIDPHLADAHMNIGVAMARQGRVEEAIVSYREALRIDSKSPEAHTNLGAALADQGHLDEAIASYQEALRIDPEYSDAHLNQARVLRKLGQFDKAIDHFRSVETAHARTMVLECLYAADQKGAFREYLGELCRSDPKNMEVAAISAFAAQQWGIEDVYPFCKNPLDFIYIVNIKSDLAPYDVFFTRIMEQINNAPAAWESYGNAAKGGFHTIGNLFDLQTPETDRLRTIILKRVEDYRTRYADRATAFVADWPEDLGLTGWHVKLLSDGHMVPHIHPGGWMSGAFYLKMPEKIEGDEGAITFTLNGYDFPIRNDDIPTVTHVPKEGDIALFPSSLFHHTIPFETDEERHCLAFDLRL